MKPAHAVVLALAALGVLYLLSRAFSVSENADFSAPPVQDSGDNGARCVSYNPDGHPGHVYGNHTGFVYTAARYPRVAGGEITAVIHNGFAPMRVPRSDWSQFIVAPPSESQWA